MSANTYMYRIRVSGENGPVRVDFLDQNNKEQGSPGGEFRYAKYRDRIELLAQKAIQAQGGRDALDKEEIRQLGEGLFNSLFDDELRTHFLPNYHKVVHGEEGNLLRIELEFDEANAPHLAALPWEFMRVPHNQITGSLWLATAPRLILARTRALWLPADSLALAPGEKLTIGMAVADPDQLGPVQHEKLWQELKALAEEHELIELLPLAHPATKDSIDALLKRRPHIFHFIGHGQLNTTDSDRQWGEIAIVREPRMARWIDSDQFSTVLNRHRPGIVVMQACEGAASSAGEAFTSVASQLVRQNIPAVIAMQYPVSNATARRFARAFYRRLAQGRPVDEAAQEGRHEISDFHDSLEFAIPVIYMRSRHGQIFTPSSATDEQPQVDRRPAQPTGQGASAASDLSPLQYRSQLLRFLSSHFSEEDLRTLTFNLGVDFDSLPAQGSSGKARELVLYLERRKRLPELAQIGQIAFPEMPWGEIA